jgi:hypothetical protein
MIEWVPSSLRRQWAAQPPEDMGEQRAATALYPEPRAIQGQPQDPPIGRSREAADRRDAMRRQLPGVPA